MSRREQPATVTAPGSSRPSGRASGPAPAACASLWEDLFRSLAPAQQVELLALARRQGLLYFHQLPAPANGRRTEPAPERLVQLLLGRTGDLPPVSSQAVAIVDELLDADQREAVARALHSPDLCLIRGGPGTGKSRVVAEIIRQATARGERVLLVAPSSAALDHTLELVSECPNVVPVRCLSTGESAAALPASIRQLTLPQQAKTLQTQARDRTSTILETGPERLRLLKQAATVWPRLEQTAQAWQKLVDQKRSLDERRAALAAEVEKEAGRAWAAAAQDSDGPDTLETTRLPALLANAARQRDEALALLDRKLAQQQAQLQERRRQLADDDAQLQNLRSLLAAKAQGRWWTAAWWRATLGGNGLERCQQLESARQQSQTRLATLEDQPRLLQEQRQRLVQTAEEQRARIVQAETNRRDQQFEAHAASLAGQQQELRQDWQSQCAGLAPEVPRPASPSLEDLQAAQRQWEQRLAQLPEQLELARQWLDYLEKTPDALAAHLRQCANLVALPAEALASDPQFGAAALAEGLATFDLLLFEEAERVTESDLLQAARRARRWVLVGNSGWVAGQEEAGRTGPARAARERSALCSRRPAPTLPSVFQRLWELLHGDPSRLPYLWKQEKDRLRCRLRSIPDNLARHVEKECVADHPEIELQILAIPGRRPELAEILFPPAMALEQAKQFVFRELQEAAVQASIPSLRWNEESDRLVLRLSDQQLAHDHVVVLGSGIREMVGSVVSSAEPLENLAVYPSCCLEFDRSAGWQRERAEEWVGKYLGLRDLGRTVDLRVCHRMSAELGGCFHGLLPLSLAGAAGGWNGRPAGSSGLEFVPVPPLGHETDRDRANGTRGRSGLPGSRLKGGAGLELDLADRRQSDRLPLEHRSHLPGHGYVNYFEAQAVVRKLAMLQRDQSAPAKPATIAVMAFSPAQVALIRRLVEQDPLVRAAGAGLWIDVPAGFRQREADVVLLSLTRSHTHRAVAFAGSLEELILAFTRARSRLIVFGDAGTLARRLQWEGALEGLDAQAVDHERALLGRLLEHCGPGSQGRHAPPQQGGRA